MNMLNAVGSLNRKAPSFLALLSFAIISLTPCWHVGESLAQSTATPIETPQAEAEPPLLDKQAAELVGNSDQASTDEESNLSETFDHLAGRGIDKKDLTDNYPPQLLILLGQFCQLAKADADYFEQEHALQTWIAAEEQLRKEKTNIKPLAYTVAWSFYNRKGVEDAFQKPCEALANFELSRQYYLHAPDECGRTTPTLEVVEWSIDYFQALAFFLEHKGYSEAAALFLEHAIKLGVDLRYEETGHTSPLSRKIQERILEKSGEEERLEGTDQPDNPEQPGSVDLPTKANSSNRADESGNKERSHYKLTDHIYRLSELARMYSAQGKKNLAQQIYLRAYKLSNRPDIKHSSIHLFVALPLAEQALEDNHTKAALEYLSIVRENVAESPQSFEAALVARFDARIALAQGDPVLAVTYLEKSRSILESEEVYELAETLDSVKQEAVREIDAVGKSAREYWDTLSLLAKSYLAQKSYAEAKEVFAKLMPGNCTGGRALDQTVELLGGMKECAEALDQQKEALSWKRKQQVIQSLIDSKATSPGD